MVCDLHRRPKLNRRTRVSANVPILPQDFDALRQLSARFGADRMHIQGAGGNSSVKDGDVMWIKASGLQMSTALDQDVFVATHLSAMRTALVRKDPLADQPKAFLLGNSQNLRPSIETSLHAVFDNRVVLHSHCVHTLAFVVRNDAKERLAERLTGFNWAFVPYAKPGANLARSVRAALASDTNVVVLGNHGLIVAGDTAGEVGELQQWVHQALAQPASPDQSADLSGLEPLLEGTEFRLPDDAKLHQLALPPWRAAQVTLGSLYPDHVIFCGIAVPAMEGGERLADVLDRIAKSGAPRPPWVLVPGGGVVVRKGLQDSTQVMMRCLADVMARVPGEAPLSYLTIEQNRELLNWDAEKYRQSLNAS